MSTKPQPISALRSKAWSSIPACPGVYWWYFPPTDIDRLHIREFCDVSRLRLRFAPDGKVCLYHGLAKDLAQRIRWHADQHLTDSCLKSGFLSTFRFTLLALNDFDYSKGDGQIDRYFDTLSVAWLPAPDRAQAEATEHAELQGPHHYPLNIQGNKKPEVAAFLRNLKAARKAYKTRHSR